MLAREGSACSVIVRCYNEGRDIGRLLEGISRQTVKDVELIIVDSGSTDRTHDILSAYKHKLVHIAPERFSFGRALNLGCAAATKPFLIFASAHTYPVYDDWIESMIAPFEDKRVALTYGCQRAPKTAPFSEQMIMRQWFPDHLPAHQDHPFCNNANAAIRREVWDRVPYDEDLTGLEDLDWAKRVIAVGHSIRYVPHAEIVHVHRERSRQTHNRYFREAIAMKRIYPEHRFSTLDLLRLTLGSIAHDYRAAAREGVLARNLWDIPRFRALQMSGAWRGVRHRGGVNDRLRRRFYYPGSPETPASTAPPAARRRIVYDDVD